jgi:predicted metal-binding membrane protein
MVKFKHGCCFALIKVMKIKGKINFIAFFALSTMQIK